MPMPRGAADYRPVTAAGASAVAAARPVARFSGGVLGVVLARRWLSRSAIAVGESLHDNPKPGITVTTVKTVQP